MSKLDELINILCPDGVKFSQLKNEVISLKKETLKTQQLIDGGEYPVINSGRTFYGFYNNYNNEGNAFTIASRGEYAGFINYSISKFWAGGLCYPYRSKNEKRCLTKFLFYFLKNKETYIRERLVAEGSIPALNKADIEKLEVPVPPLEVQCEIVRILDNFAELTAELTAELSLRKSQYDIYRNKLFQNIQNNDFVTLDSLCKIITKQTGFDYSATIKPSLITFKDESSYSFIQNKDFNGLKINFDTDFFIPKSVAHKFPKILLDQPCILISISGKIGNIGFFDSNNIAFIGGAVCICKLKEHVNGRYLLYYLQSSFGQRYLFKSVKAASHLNITVEDIRKLQVVLPLKKEQDRIVNLLDNYDLYCNDMVNGLPAEIEGRKKQYEYYRDKILTFKRLED